MKSNPPKHYRRLKKAHPEFIASWDAIGKAVRDTGPLSPKIGHLIQLAAAAAVRSEGAVHSHVRRLVELKAKPAEIRQAVMLTAATIGFPAVMAALSWADDILEGKR
jgi:alkylhydroperoxidase/carboxymuconolactone decarboxylase family protein YurZ